MTESRYPILIRDYESGMTISEICKKHKTTKRTVNKALAIYGIDSIQKPMRMKDETISSLLTIANHYGLPTQTTDEIRKAQKKLTAEELRDYIYVLKNKILIVV